MKKLTIKAPAKVNLFLKVLGKRPDGYHDIYSWFQAVDLFDILTLNRIEDPSFSLHITGTDDLKADDSNLVIKAARLMFGRFDLAGGLEITLHKNIPVSAGLAGGSSDAAATMEGINRLFGLGLGGRQLARIGLKLGSDIPFFFSGGQAEVTGRGEKIKKIYLPLNYCLILITPDILISTAESYAGLKMGLTSPGNVIKLFRCKDFKELVGRSLESGNDFERAHFRSFPELPEIRDALENIGAAVTRMSGSGPTMFGMFEYIPEGDDLHRITRGNWRMNAVRPITLPAWD